MFTHLIVLSVLLLATQSFGQSSDKTYSHHVKIPYFTNTIMTCDHPDLNISRTAGDIKALTWVFPDGKNVASAANLDRKKFVLSQPDSSIDVVGDKANLVNYNLTVLKVDDDVFGYYLCVVEYKAATNKSASVIRWALNVNGADFSELLDTYKKNAIIGGVAAAVMLVAVGGGCLFWQYRYGNRVSDEEEEDGDDLKKDGVEMVAGAAVSDAASKAKGQSQVYTNESYSPEVDPAQIDLHADSNGSKMISIPL